MKTPRISKSDLLLYASVAKREGVTVEIERDGVIFRISPATCQEEDDIDREIADIERRWTSIPSRRKKP